jgi:hypothetical protein
MGREKLKSATFRINDAISIHTPLAGRDLPCGYGYVDLCKFQPTRSTRGVTKHERQTFKIGGISIHSPRVGRDALP